jgi:hypothetical protein
VEETSSDPDYSKFREKLLSAKSKNKRGEEGMGGRYAVFDVEYEADGGEGKRSKITFISWVPDDAPQYVSIHPVYFARVGERILIWSSLAPHDVLLLERITQASTQRSRRRHPGQ